jgi:23S rRNA (adenine2503-C2)-methyltransferase
MFNVFRSSDGLVSKYNHKDTSETSIKVVPSKDTGLDGTVRVNDRGKYTVFISSSAGCYLSCTFCDLTISGMKYRKLKMEQVLDNLKEALEEKISFDPSIKERYIKLSWMGMGDALNDPEMVQSVSLSFLNWVMESGYAAGLDGLDLSTSFAKISSKHWIDVFSDLNMQLSSFPRNPHNRDGRPPFRLFYSLHSGFEGLRQTIVPRTMEIEKVFPRLQEAREQGLQIIFHYTMLEGVNDSVENAEKLVSLLEKNDFAEEEIRFLRYNPHPDSPYEESSTRIEFARRVAEKHPNIKLQISEGREVRSACGQFMYGQCNKA